MKFYIVIPAHNEQDSIGLTLDSLVNQSLKPKHLVIVDDNSTDDTAKIVSNYTTNYPWITLVNNTSSISHLPGSKIIQAFYAGYDMLDEDYDVICKYDADLIFPHNYLETVAKQFEAEPKLGMAAGHCFIEKNDTWVREGLTSKVHIRGALKAYRKQCFLEIGKLKPAMGWDTIDELLALYYNWTFKTIDTLEVKHLKPTGASYNKASKHLQGEAWYKLRFGFLLSFLSALKLAWKKRCLSCFINDMTGFLLAWKQNSEFLITVDQGKFIRNHRWSKIIKKVF